ncbi:uncharacterized protein N7483_004687 [Penicillium malachiteum]|uniref:uncharacterized protein n=1 Tax=Penicillium malachiteum TaxID=1324776 RepID=UPI002549A662|nr:uncharacterized protein N7483_004687 [Penicillium malachiteum]KAJ5730179.1 hypothetical protein N7483_004687 [Penicillium malachiteum]
MNYSIVLEHEDHAGAVLEGLNELVTPEATPAAALEPATAREVARQRGAYDDSEPINSEVLAEHQPTQPISEPTAILDAVDITPQLQASYRSVTTPQSSVTRTTRPVLPQLSHVNQPVTTEVTHLNQCVNQHLDQRQQQREYTPEDQLANDMDTYLPTPIGSTVESAVESTLDQGGGMYVYSRKES